MKRVVKFALALILASYFCSLSATRTWAAGTPLLSDESLVASVRAIVTGKVTRIESRWDANRKNVYTDITVAVAQVLKGNITSNTIVIEQLGGRVGNRHSWLIGSPQFTLGEDALLFLNANEEGVLHTAHLSMGKFSIVTDSSTGARAIIRTGDLQRRAADQYIEQIKQLLIQESERVSYFDNLYGTKLLSAPADYVPGMGEEQPNFTLLTSRFFEPDNGMPVTFVLNPKSAPVSGGGVTELNKAITAWNNAGSRLRLVNGGSTTLCGFHMDQNSVISFGDCDKVLDNPVDGKGVLVGVMLVSDDKDFRIINGNKFSHTLEADIVFNDGFDDVLGISSNLEELITHALGNGFGLDNSSTDPNEPDQLLREAIMYFKPHFDGRGARLNTDDQTGVNRLYPFFTPVQFPAANLAMPIINIDFQLQLVATNGFPTFTFALTGGNLPEGLMLSNTGLISGRAKKIETANFTVTVTDSANFSASQNFTLKVGAVAPRVLSVSPTRLCYNASTPVTISGGGFLGTTGVTLSPGSVNGFMVVDDATIQVLVTGPGRTGVVADAKVTNPASSSTLASAILFDGPMLRSARIDKVTRKNKNNKPVMTRAIIIDGDGLAFGQILTVNDSMTSLTAGRDFNGNFIFFGSLSGAIPRNGQFMIKVIDPGLNNCQSNAVAVKRR